MIEHVEHISRYISSIFVSELLENYRNIGHEQMDCMKFVIKIPPSKGLNKNHDISILAKCFNVLVLLLYKPWIFLDNIDDFHIVYYM